MTSRCSITGPFHRSKGLLAGLIFLGWATSGWAAMPGSDWDTYQAIIWQNKSKTEYAGLRRLGVTAAQVQPNRVSRDQSAGIHKALTLRSVGLRPYVENMATDFYSAYHRWAAGRPVNERFLAAKAIVGAHTGISAGFIRDPSLADARA